ncbi:MAG: ABC transporter ATP-binding protein [Rubricoccaceae bacterium]
MPQLPNRRELLGWLGYARQALVLVRQAAPVWSVVWAALIVVQGLLPVALVALTKWVVDAVADAIGQGLSTETVVLVVTPAALMGGLLLLQRVMGGLMEWVGTAQAELVDDHVRGLIHEKAVAVDFGFYESSEYHDLLEQVRTQGSSRTLQLLQNVGGLGQATVTFVSIAALLASYAWWIPLALAASAYPAFLIVLRHNRIYHRWWQETTPQRRLGAYFDTMLTLDGAAAEVRVNRLGEGFRARYREVRRVLREARLRLLRNQIIARTGAAFLGLIVTAAVMLWIVARALRGQATIGDLALFYGAFNQGQAVVGGILQNAGQVYVNTLFLEHLYRFLGLRNTVVETEGGAAFPSEVREGIRFEKVHFSYPGAERPALQGLDLEIPAGKMVAVVGENGAGKSTFIKLLCRFYDPDAGRITVDGIDLREIPQDELRRHISVLFQFPMKYQMTAAQNIRMSDGFGGPPAEGDEARIKAAAVAAGADGFLEALPARYETLLGRWFENGTELSGGQWQRVALARAFFREAPIVILDEPTSYMDSWSENDWLARFRRMVEGRMSLVITHRFTTAMQADIIYVMDQGRVVEAGTHAELVRRGGHYAASWHAQVLQAEKAGQENRGATLASAPAA